jgi:uncharacterized delta-60 repeat protein
VKRAASLALLMLGLAAPAADAAPGDLDPSFGQGGVERILQSEEEIAIEGAAVQPDGRIVLAGHSGENVLVARLLDDGSFDPGFGTGGITVSVLPSGFSEARAVALQPDGRIVVAGGGIGAGGEDFFVARYTQKGQLDPSFGGGDGYETVTLSLGQDEAEAVAIGAEGRILITGRAAILEKFEEVGEQVGVAVLDASGNPDAAFGSGLGVKTFTTPGGLKNEEGVAIAERPGGGYVVADNSGSGVGNGFTILALLPGGGLDPGFGEKGVVVTPIPPTNRGRVDDLIQLADGRIVAAGYGFDEAMAMTDAKFAAVRYLANGELDKTFGGGIGIFTRQVGPGEDTAAAVLPAAGGRYLLAGSWEPATATNSPAALRLDAAGALDPGFGVGGVVARPTLSAFGDRTEAAAVDSRERLLVVSRNYLGGGQTAIELTRFLGDIPPEPPAGGGQIGPPAPPVNRGPTVRIKAIPKALVADKLKGFAGTASDADGDGLAKVQVALLRKVGGGPKAKATPSAAAGPGAGAKGKAAKRTCLSLRNAKGGFKTSKVKKPKPCPPLWLTAKGTGKWSFKLGGTLPPGRYVLQARALDSRGATGPATRVAFKLTAE